MQDNGRKEKREKENGEKIDGRNSAATTLIPQRVSSRDTFSLGLALSQPPRKRRAGRRKTSLREQSDLSLLSSPLLFSFLASRYGSQRGHLLVLIQIVSPSPSPSFSL